MMSESMGELTSEIDSVATHNKILETQIAQQESFSSRSQGIFPGKPKINPNKHCNMVTLRSGMLLEDLKEGNDVRRNIEMEATEKAK